jgi:hypothetical protein
MRLSIITCSTGAPNLIKSKRSCTDKALSAFEGALSRGLAEDNTVDCPGGQYEPMCQ